MSTPSISLLYFVSIITICLRPRFTLATATFKSNQKMINTDAKNDDTEIVIKGEDIDASDRDFIKAIEKNLTTPEISNMENTAKFLSAIKLKNYRRTHQQNKFPNKYISRDVSSARVSKTKANIPRNNLGVTTPKKVTLKPPASKDNQTFTSTLNPNKPKTKMQGITTRKESTVVSNPLRIIEASFKHLQPGDVVLWFHLIIWNSGSTTLKIMTTHNCCFTMPKLEPDAEDSQKPSGQAETNNCQSMALVGQREYTLVANETRNVTLLFASTQLLLYQYQRKGYCEVDFIVESEHGSLLASRKINFDTALGRPREKDKKTKLPSHSYLRTAHLELKDGLYTGRLCEDRNCIPVDCIQEFGGGANRFSVYRGKCITSVYCAANGSMFYDTQWNRCQQINDLRLDQIKDLDEVPQIVKKVKSPLTTGMEKLLPAKDLRTLPHLICDQLKNVAERTWGRAFLCQNLPLVCKRCSIK